MRYSVTFIFLLLIFKVSGQNKSPKDICNLNIVYDSVKVDDRFYLYKTIFKKDKVAEAVLPEFNRKSDSIILHKVMSKIGKLHKVRFLTVGQNCAVIKMIYNPFKPTSEEEKRMQEEFIGIFDLLTNKRVKHP